MTATAKSDAQLPRALGHPHDEGVQLFRWNGGLHTRWHGAKDAWVHSHKDGTVWEWINPTTERWVAAAYEDQP